MAFTPHHQRSKKDRDFYDWATLVVAAFGVLAVAITVGISVWNNVLVGNQLALTEKAFRIDARPWVHIGKIEADLIPPSKNDTSPRLFAFRLFLENAGKSGAYDIVVRSSTVRFGGGWNNPALIDDYMRRTFEGGTVDSLGQPLHPIAPNEIVPRYLPPETTAIAPYIGSAEEPQLNPDLPSIEINGAKLTRDSVSAIAGRITYTDIFKVQHWSNYCFMVVKDGKTIPCFAGNDTDRHY